MEDSKKKMLREVSHDRLTPKKRDDLVQSEIFGDFLQIVVFVILFEPLIVILVSLDTKFITSLEQIITRPLYNGRLSYTRYYHKPAGINGSITLTLQIHM